MVALHLIEDVLFCEDLVYSNKLLAFFMHFNTLKRPRNFSESYYG
jgi:hypothetical protein